MDLKPFLTLDQQLNLLKERGLIIDDDTATIKMLSKLNYYRLSGYSLTLKRGERFNSNIHFDDIMEIYNFDRELKAIMLCWLEEVEISLRTHIAYTLGEIDPKSYLDSTIFISEAHYEQFTAELSRALSDNKNEAFIKHHNRKYNGKLPVWVIVETLSFGALSRFFSSLDVTLKKEICSMYYHEIRYTYIENWLEGLVVVRNLCAHHSRLFNRGLPNAIRFPRRDFEFLTKDCGYSNDAVGKKLFFPAIILDRISNDFSETFMTAFEDLQQKYKFVDIKYYGFLKDWSAILSYLNEEYK